MLVENFFKEEDISMKLLSLQSYGMALTQGSHKNSDLLYGCGLD